jgi:CheY-like chemotaxis protein
MSTDQEPPRGLKCVLCVDDEDDFQSVIRISLERVGGIQAHFCSDPRHAIAQAREVRPDLILLDFMMPVLDGPAVFKRLKADPELAGIPVVFLTAVMTGPGLTDLRSLGAAGVLIKPFDLLDLPRKLSEIWKGLPQ